MALPTIPKKTFDVKNRFLPNGKIKMVPFGVGQEQFLIEMKDSEDAREKIGIMKTIIEQCIQTPGVDVGALPLFIIEDIFLRLKEHSSGEIVELGYECTNVVEEKACGNKIKLELDVREFVLTEDSNHSNKILIADPIGVKFRYPTLEMSEKVGYDITDDRDMILACIELIYDADNVYPAEEHTREELVEFWNQLTLPQKKEVYEKFFLSMPHLHYKKTIKCSKCGTEHEIEFNSLAEVFT